MVDNMYYYRLETIFSLHGYILGMVKKEATTKE